MNKRRYRETRSLMCCWNRFLIKCRINFGIIELISVSLYKKFSYLLISNVLMPLNMRFHYDLCGTQKILEVLFQVISHLFLLPVLTL